MQVQQTKLVQAPGLHMVTSQIAATHPSSGSQTEKPKDSTLGLSGVVPFQADPWKHSGTQQLIQSSQAMSQSKSVCTIPVLHLWFPKCCSPARWSPPHQDHPRPPAPAVPWSRGSVDLLKGNERPWRGFKFRDENVSPAHPWLQGRTDWVVFSLTTPKELELRISQEITPKTGNYHRNTFWLHILNKFCA